MFYPARHQGTLINQFISSHEDNIAAPEKIALCGHAKRALCISVEDNMTSTAGWITTNDGIKAQKSLLPYMSDLINAIGSGNRTPIWIEYEINDALRGGDCAQDIYMGSRCGALFVPEIDEDDHPLSCGIVTVINHGGEKQYCAGNNLRTGVMPDLGQSGMTICPVISHIDYRALELLSKALKPSAIDGLMHRNYSESEWRAILDGLDKDGRSKSTASGEQADSHQIAPYSDAPDIGAMMARCMNTSILPGLVTDACIINGWGDDLREKYVKDSSVLSLRYGIFSSVLFALTQISGRITIPGHVRNQSGRLTWQRGLFERERRLQTLIMTPDITGQVCLPRVRSPSNPDASDKDQTTLSDEQKSNEPSDRSDGSEKE